MATESQENSSTDETSEESQDQQQSTTSETEGNGSQQPVENPEVGGHVPVTDRLQHFD